MTRESLPESDWQQTELPLMLSVVVSPAKISASRDAKKVLLTEHAAAFGQKLLGLLANYDPPSQSWRTSQICLVALATGLADGLAEYSGTWPNSGMMLNGKTFQRQPWALPIAANASGSLPTPVKYDATPGGPNNQLQGLGLARQALLADPHGERCPQPNIATIADRSGFDNRGAPAIERTWGTEPRVGRVAHGVPNGVDRIAALGNAVVPQIPELIGRAILAAGQA
jgi:hypothetical protein